MINYGIFNESSDLRVHVCPITRCIYVFPTIQGAKAILPERHRKTIAHQPGVNFPTAEGFLVPPGDIPQSVLLKLREQAWDAIDFCDCDTTTQKGAKAVQLVVGMIKAGLFPLPGLPHEQQDKAMQIAGDDIIVHLETKDIRIQVKCDFRGGERQYGGTGFLFLQTAEINPLKYH